MLMPAMATLISEMMPTMMNTGERKMGRVRALFLARAVHPKLAET